MINHPKRQHIIIYSTLKRKMYVANRMDQKIVSKTCQIIKLQRASLLLLLLLLLLYLTLSHCIIGSIFCIQCSNATITKNVKYKKKTFKKRLTKRSFEFKMITNLCGMDYISHRIAFNRYKSVVICVQFGVVIELFVVHLTGYG